jgi:hypothetical protein
MVAARAILPAAFALLLVLPPAPAIAQNYVRFHRYYDGDKLLFCFEAPMARVKKLPLWDGKGEPPMSRDRAIEIGAEHLRSSYPRVGKFKPHRVELGQIDVRYDIFGGIVWYYLVEYAAETDGDARLSSTEYLAIVLFDGKPVPKTMGKCTPLFAPNSALLTDAYLALRSSSGAAKRER